MSTMKNNGLTTEQILDFRESLVIRKGGIGPNIDSTADHIPSEIRSDILETLATLRPLSRLPLAEAAPITGERER